MSGNHPAVVANSERTRSRVTNGSQSLLFGDGRSAGARRYRDLHAAFASELGNVDTLPPSSKQIVRRLAQVSVELELLEAQRATGGDIDPVAFVTLVNSQRRLLRDLRALVAQQPREKPPTLQEALAAGRTAAP